MSKSMAQIVSLCLLVGISVESAAAGAASVRGWTVVAAGWRPDANPFVESQVWEDHVWTEGWGYEEQFYPKYMRPAGSLHVILRNDSGKTDSISLESIKGKPLAEAITSERQLGPVVWYLIESPQLPVDPKRPDDAELNVQRNVPPGEWVECLIRMREVPRDAMRIGFSTSGGAAMEVTVEPRASTLRIESVSFSPKIDLIYVYVHALDGKVPSRLDLQLDGRQVRSRAVQGPPGSGLVLLTAALSPAWEYGSHHLVEVRARGEKLTERVRAWDGFYSLGLFGTADKEHVAAARAHGINTYYWNNNQVLDEAGMCTIPAHLPTTGVPRTAGGAGMLFLYNKDEPDAGDAGRGDRLPHMDRLGLMAIPEVIPLMRGQRRLWPTVPNLLLVDNTYKPLNYYVYGRIPDVFSTDPYVPLNGRQVDYVYHALECARDASTPRPLVAVLWACSLGGKRKFGSNAPTPEEMRMMIYYAIGCGAKGIGYFIDMTKTTGEGSFVGLSDIKPLWEEVGRSNREVAALAGYLAVGCPAGPHSMQGKVWVRSVMCGPDAMIVVAVNTNHYIAYETQKEVSFHFPLRNADVNVPLPRGFGNVNVQEVVDGRLVPYAHQVSKGKITLRLDTLDAARVFLVTAGPPAPSSAKRGEFRPTSTSPGTGTGR
ncbi:MAG: hypothetical protein ACP5R5_05675 [Armatimonadota bacterium]